MLFCQVLRESVPPSPDKTNLKQVIRHHILRVFKGL